MICRNIEDGELFYCCMVNFSWHLWNDDNDFRVDIDTFEEDYEIINEDI